MSDSAQRYRVIEKLESGGMAEVFRAESEGLQGFKKQVAIKRVLPHLSEKKKFISMFLDEARLSAHLSHSNCVQVFDIGVGDNAYFIVMEFVDGANLKTIAESLKKQGKQFPVPAAVLIAHEICKGLSYAHELCDPNGNPLNIVHRDMSPPNVLITKYGEVKIVDFGLAKANSQLEKSEPGIIKGKFSYLSPEAALGQDVDHRTDIFAVGIILWELLAGQRLFLGETDFQTVKKVQQAVIPSVSQYNRHVRPDLERIVNRILARDPSLRYQSARELGRDLANCMFRLAEPVSSFDIETLVHVAVRDKQRIRPPQPSIIDKLIEEALFEFTSLKDDDRSAPESKHSSPKAAPLNLGDFEDPSRWMTEINTGEFPGTGAPLSGGLPGDALSEGNLSALEDLEEPPRPPTPIPRQPRYPLPPRPRSGSGGGTGGGTGGGFGGGPSGTMRMSALPPMDSPLVTTPTPPNVASSGPSHLHPAVAGGPSAIAMKKPTSTATVGIVVVLAALMATGVAWFAHLIPHL
ncbi:serine/threonine protein kinase [Pendulispora brunnea]|uniref:Serine/threonine protein kinase n=1 Tax=Pendulispora brunnea TaxID=2905690 RepID=A0ABZ2K0Q3_9BACT